MKSEAKLEGRDVETMKVMLRGMSVVACPSMRVMKSVIQEKNKGPEVLKIEVEGEIQAEISVEIGLVEAVDLAMEAQGGTATGGITF